MRDRSKRWLFGALAVGVADGAILLAAGVILPTTQQLHASGLSLVAAMTSELGSLVPAGVAAGLGAILGVFGAGWWQQHLLGPALSSTSDAAGPAFAGVLASPVYAIVRRNASRKRAPMEWAQGCPPHRIYVAAAKVPGPTPSPSARAYGPA